METHTMKNPMPFMNRTDRFVNHAANCRLARQCSGVFTRVNEIAFELSCNILLQPLRPRAPRFRRWNPSPRAPRGAPRPWKRCGRRSRRGRLLKEELQFALFAA